MNVHADLLTVTEAAKWLRISRNLAYELVRQERLPHLHLGKRILIPRDQLVEWITAQSASQLGQGKPGYRAGRTIDLGRSSDDARERMA